MGIFSDIQRFHGAGERPNENVLERFGAPARSLYTELDPGDLHQKISVRDEQYAIIMYMFVTRDVSSILTSRFLIARIS